MSSKLGSNHRSLMRKLAKLTSILFAFAFLGMQFVPTATMPKTSATTGAHMAEVINPQVGAILDRSCQDCHSSRTTWPWYSHVAPVSWVVSKHVSAGREILDFSDWANQPHSADERMLICDAVSDGRMPLPEYTFIHRSAKLSKQDVEVICNWATAPSAPNRKLGTEPGISENLKLTQPLRNILQNSETLGFWRTNAPHGTPFSLKSLVPLRSSPRRVPASEEGQF